MEKRRKKMEEKVIKKDYFTAREQGEREKRKVRFSFDSEL